MASKKQYMTAKIKEQLVQEAKELAEAQLVAIKNNLREEFKAKELADKLLFLYDKIIEFEENIEEEVKKVYEDLDKKENVNDDNYSM